MTEQPKSKSIDWTDAEGPFRLLETLRWTPDEGFFMLDRHLARLARSAGVLGFAVDAMRVAEALTRAAGGFSDGVCKVRALVGRGGEVEVQSVPLGAGGRAVPWRVGLAREPVDSRDWRLQHKTTARELYERACAGRPDLDDVILHNERGEVTECTVANLVIERDGRRVTPPLACGLLAGTFREHLLERGEIREDVIGVEELRGVKTLFLINSVREWIPARVE